MMTAAQGSLGESLKLDWMRTPQTMVVVPVTAAAANKARSSKGARFHINRLSLSLIDIKSAGRSCTLATL
jgi:hypothetical protein